MQVLFSKNHHKQLLLLVISVNIIILFLVSISHFKDFIFSKNIAKETLKINKISRETFYLEPKLNIYQATTKELEQIKYIGNKTAKKIYNNKSLTEIKYSEKIKQYVNYHSPSNSLRPVSHSNH